MNRFVNWKTPQFSKEGWAFIFGDGPLDIINFNWLCFHPENLKLGKGSDIGSFTLIQARFGVEIGEDVQIGSGVKIHTESTIDNKIGKIIIKEGACVGSNSVILPGVIIGKNSVVGSCSVIKSGTIIPDNEIWVGIPAKKKGEIKNGRRTYHC